MEKTLRTSFGVEMQATRRDNFYEKEGFSLCNTAALKLILSAIGYCKLFFTTVPLFPILLLFYLFVSIEIDKTKSAIQSILKFMI